MPDPEQTRAHPELRIKRPVGEAPVRKRLALKKTAAPRLPQPQPSTDVGPAFFRALLWIALVGWLLFLAFKLLEPLPFLFPVDDIGAYTWWQGEQAAREPEIAERDVEAADAQDDPALRTLKGKVVEAMLAGAVTDAVGLIERQQHAPDIYPYQDELTELANFVRAVSRVNAVVADAIRARIDEEVVIRVKDRRITIIPRASAGDRINAIVVPSRADQPSHSATFTVSDLDPIERAHWVGQADTPQKCAMKLLLHLSAGDREGARVFAPSCGILANAFEEQLGAAANHGPATP